MTNLNIGTDQSNHNSDQSCTRSRELMMSCVSLIIPVLTLIFSLLSNLVHPVKMLLSQLHCAPPSTPPPFLSSSQVGNFEYVYNSIPASKYFKNSKFPTISSMRSFFFNKLFKNWAQNNNFFNLFQLISIKFKILRSRVRVWIVSLMTRQS